VDDTEAERRLPLSFVSSLSFSLTSRLRDEEMVGDDREEVGDASGEAELSDVEAEGGDLSGGEVTCCFFPCGEAAVCEDGVPGAEPGVNAEEPRTEKADGRLEGCVDEDWDDSRKAEGEAAGSEAEEREEAEKVGEAMDSEDGAAADDRLVECSGDMLGDDEGEAVLAMDACLR
jgi:hypothetical protein